MQLKVRCPACGKGIRVTEGDAGRIALCPACGHRVEIGHAPLLGPLADASPAGVAEQPDPPPSQSEREPLPAAGLFLTTPASDFSAGTGPFAAAGNDAEQSPADFFVNGDAVASGGFRPAADSSSHANDSSKSHYLIPAESSHVDASGFAPVPPSAVPPAFVEAETAAPAELVAAPRSFPLSEAGTLGLPPGYSFGDPPAVATPGAARAGWWLALAAMSVAVIGIAAMLGAFGPFESWESLHRSTLVKLKVRAETAAASGNIDDALSAYHEIDKTVGDRVLSDPALKELADAARSNQAVYAHLLNRERVAAKKADAERERRTALAAIAPPAPASVVKVERPATNPDDPIAEPPPLPAVQPASRPKPAPPRQARRPEPRAVPADPETLTDERIGQAIGRGANWLLNQFDPGETVRAADRNDSSYSCGLNALAVYALLQSGQAMDDGRFNPRGPQMRPKLEALKKIPVTGYHQTYARGLRATCLALFNRPEDLRTLQDDADYLLGSSNGGAYSYSGDRVPKLRRTFADNGGGWDNSNSQYGVLGVWSASDAEPSVDVPVAYWRAVQRHWTEHQLNNGQWGYGISGRQTMTAAGIASLFVAQDNLGDAANSAAVGREPFSPALKKALDYFEEGDHATRVESQWWGYALYGIERVGLASGFKHFGGRDWYRDLSQQVVRRQNGNGAWGDGVIDTSYALLFLSRGRHPILMNKLRFDRPDDAGQTPSWCNRPRDLANASRFATRQLERPINWQVVSLDNPWTDWTDSPILYIASHEPPKFVDADYEKLRAFVDAGGMIFTHADTGSPTFSAWAAELAKRLFPQYELADLPPDHLIYNVLFKPNPRPPLKAVSNGSRVLLLHSPTDLAVKWQQRQDRAWEGNKAITDANSATRAQQLAPFHFAVNLFVYAAGKRDLRNRLDSPWVAAPETAPSLTTKIARLRHGGNWDPEPGAWTRYANWFQRQTNYKLTVSTVSLTELKPGDAPFAHLTGAGHYEFTNAEVAALKAFVEAGGVLLIDHTGGVSAFGDDIRTLLTRAFPDRFEAVLEADHPLLTDSAPGMDLIGKPRLRPYAMERVGTTAGSVGLLTAGKGHVIVTGVDVTSGLLGTRTWGVLGYQPVHCQMLVKNAILWTLDGQPGAQN